MNEKKTVFQQKFQELLQEKNNGSQKEFSKETDIPASTINNWYNGKKEPQTSQLLKIADYFQVSVDYLLGREDEIGGIKINSELTDLENSLISQFRKLSPTEQNRAYKVIKTLLES